MEKTCNKCKCTKSLDCFTKRKQSKDGYHFLCKPCRVKEQRKYFLRHPETQRAYKRKWNATIKQQVFTHYCGSKAKCAKCGFSDQRALTVDHINGNGTKHRKQIGGGFYRWIVKNNFPRDLQILCMNCQFIKKAENRESTPLK